MSKATPDEVIVLGFSHEVFAPAAASESALHVMVQDILDEIVPEVKEAIGTSAYDSASNLADVKRIEKYLAASELWERRRNIALKNRDSGGGNLLNMIESVTAEEYRDKARRVIDRLQGRTGMAASVEKSGHFPQDV